MTASAVVQEHETLWRAVAARDAAFDGRFVFGVRSTGIYCRPSCPSRRPRRDRVVFFAGPDAAEGAGFRACRRCAPRLQRPRSETAAWVRRACRLIEERGGEGLSLASLSRELGVSPHHLQRMFRQSVGLSPRQYAEALRTGALKAGLREGRRVSDAIYEAGFGSASRVYSGVSQALGMTPTSYKAGGHGMRIGYAIADCRLGRVLVAATERGVSSVCLGDDDARLEAELRAEYPKAEIRRRDEALGPFLEAVLRLVEGRPPRLELPLDVQATAFQWRVYQELRRIPAGETRSYAEVARAVGRPSAARAVARACATNPVALVVPCHRVVGAGGGLSGYRWGKDRKRALLARERGADERSQARRTSSTKRPASPSELR